MTKILNSGDIEEIFNKLAYVPSLNDELSPYERDEVYNYALRFYYERIYYWEAKYSDSDLYRDKEIIRNVASSVDEGLQNARIVLTLLEKRMDIPEDKKMFPTGQTLMQEDLTKEKKQRNEIGIKRMYVFYLGLLHIRGRFTLGHINQDVLDDQIEESLKRVGAKNVSAQNVRKLLVGQFSTKDQKQKEKEKEKEIIFVMYNKQSKQWEFNNDKFDLKKSKYPKAYNAAKDLIKR